MHGGVTRRGVPWTGLAWRGCNAHEFPAVLWHGGGGSNRLESGGARVRVHATLLSIQAESDQGKSSQVKSGLGWEATAVVHSTLA